MTPDQALDRLREGNRRFVADQPAPVDISTRRRLELAKGQKPFAALIGCAEAYDAMTHHRAWRPSRSGREALAEIERLQGTQFAPVAVQALRHVVGLRRMAIS